MEEGSTASPNGTFGQEIELPRCLRGSFSSLSALARSLTADWYSKPEMRPNRPRARWAAVMTAIHDIAPEYQVCAHSCAPQSVRAESQKSRRRLVRRRGP